jgi:hypothetical protein
MKTFLILAILITSLISTTACAWGPTGHRVVGEIASKYLTRKSKRNIKKILAGHTLSRVANWPDKIKSDPDQYKYTYSWHYMQWPTHQRDHDPASHGSLAQAITENLKVLRNKKETIEQRAFALKFVVHLVGDLHQPLHVGNGLDQGGNKCRVFFHNKATNLHQLWDEKLIEFTHLSYSEFANYINIYDKSELKKIKSGTVLDWAQESKILREQVYPKEVIAATAAIKTKSADPAPLKNYCNSELNLSDSELPKLSYNYSYKFLPIAERRMREAGIRLAMLINESF